MIQIDTFDFTTNWKLVKPWLSSTIHRIDLCSIFQRIDSRLKNLHLILKECALEPRMMLLKHKILVLSSPCRIVINAGRRDKWDLIPIFAEVTFANTSLFHPNLDKGNKIQSDHQQKRCFHGCCCFLKQAIDCCITFEICMNTFFYSKHDQDWMFLQPSLMISLKEISGIVLGSKENMILCSIMSSSIVVFSRIGALLQNRT